MIYIDPGQSSQNPRFFFFFFFDSKSYTQTKNSQDNFEEHDGKTLEDGLTYKNHSN